MVTRFIGGSGIKMETKILCRTCNKYYCFFDDNEELLTEGCKIDLPVFDGKSAIVCTRYCSR